MGALPTVPPGLLKNRLLPEVDSPVLVTLPQTVGLPCVVMMPLECTPASDGSYPVAVDTNVLDSISRFPEVRIAASGEYGKNTYSALTMREDTF